MADQRLLELFDADQIGGEVSGVPTPRGLGVDGAGEVFFADPAVAAERAAQAGGRRLRRRRKTQRGGKRKTGGKRNRSTFRLNLRAQIRLRSRSQRRH